MRGRIFSYSLFLGSFLFLSACSTYQTYSKADDLEANRRPIIVHNNVQYYGPTSPHQLNMIESAAGAPMAQMQIASLNEDSATEHCRLKDRFDRKELIAYNFADGQSRLGLKMGVDGFSLSDAGNFSFEEIELRFRYRLQKYKKKHERCLYNSSWQGLVGSGYNEFYGREEKIIYRELDEELDEINERLGRFL